MTSNFNGLKRLADIPPEKEFWIGSIFREYGVGRLGAKSENENYYDLMLVDISILVEDAIALVNITLTSDNRGRIVAIIPNKKSQYFILADELNNYFSSENKIYFVEDIALLNV